MIKKQSLFLIIIAWNGLCLNASDMSDMSDKEFEALGTELGALQDANTPEMSDKEFEAFGQESPISADQEIEALEDDAQPGIEDQQEEEEIQAKEEELLDLVAEAKKFLDDEMVKGSLGENHEEKARRALYDMKKVITLFDKKVAHAVDDIKGKFNPEHLNRLNQLTKDLDDAYSKAASLTNAQIKEIGAKFIQGVDHIIFMLEQAGRYRGFNWLEAQQNKYKKMFNRLQKRVDKYEKMLSQCEKIIDEKEATIAEIGRLYKEEKLRLQQQLDLVKKAAREVMHRCEEQMASFKDSASMIDEPIPVSTTSSTNI